MDNAMVKISNNWTQTGGCPFSQSFKLLTADTDFFNRPDLSDIVDEEKSILLNKSDSLDSCELSMSIYPHYKFQCLSLVTNVAKIEIFFGQIKEYLETIYGVIVAESDDQFKSYRYDIEVEKSGVTDITLKFLTHSSEVCIFGIILYVAPNPNGITSLLPSANCSNIDNTKTKQDSNKSKQLVELMKMLSNHSLSASNTTLDHLNKPKVTEKIPSTDQLYELKLYIDECFKKLEERLESRLEKMEKMQMCKLHDILNRLETLK